MKRIIALMLALMMVIFAGCASEKGEVTDQKRTEKDENKKSGFENYDSASDISGQSVVNIKKE